MNRRLGWAVALGLFCCAQNQPPSRPLVRGKVTDLDGRPLSQAQVSLRPAGAEMFDLDNDGRKDLFFATSHFPGSEPYVHSPAETPNHVLRIVGRGYFEYV